MSGTKSTAAELTKRLAAQEICLIIESSAQHKVSLLKFGDLEIRFGPPAAEQAQLAQMYAQSTPGVEIPDHDAINAETLRRNTSEIRAEQLEELKITNPSLYEEFVMQEGLEDVDDESGDGE